MSSDTTVEMGGVSAEPVSGATSVQARRYTHPQAPSRTVVRLVAEGLDTSTDAVLAARGFIPDGHREVGYGQRQGLGFPAWPITQRPDSAEAVLAALPALERARDLAETFPTTAVEVVEGAAARLGGSCPEAVPTLYEELGRTFLELGTIAGATRCFTKAREAERAYGLAVDEDQHRSVLWEFALAGAVSGEELGEESIALADRLPEGALEGFVELNRERVRCGLRPYSALPGDLHHLATEAGADPARVLADLLRDIAALPAVARASVTFWVGCEPALGLLLADGDEVARAVLDLVPDALRPSGALQPSGPGTVPDQAPDSTADQVADEPSETDETDGPSETDEADPASTAADSPGATDDGPGPDLDGADDPGTDEPSADEPSADEPSADEPGTAVDDPGGDALADSPGAAGDDSGRDRPRTAADSPQPPDDPRADPALPRTGARAGWPTAARLDPKLEKNVWNVAEQLSGSITSGGWVNDEVSVLLLRPETVAHETAQPFADRSVLGRSAALLTLLLDSGLYSPTGVALVEDYEDPRAVVPTPWGNAVGGRSILYPTYQRDRAGQRLRYARDEGGQGPQGTVESDAGKQWVVVRASGVPEPVLREMLQVLLTEEPPAWDPSRAEQLAAGTGWTRAAAAYFLAGTPRLRAPGRLFLPKQVRTGIGLSVTEALTAQDFFQRMSDAERYRLVAAGCADPVRTAREGIDIEAVIEAWRAEHGEPLVLPDWLVTVTEKALPHRGAGMLAQLLSAPSVVSLPIWLWAASRVPRTDPVATVLADAYERLRDEVAVRPVQSPELGARSLLGARPNPERGSRETIGAWTFIRDRIDRVSWDPQQVVDWHKEYELVEQLPAYGKIRWAVALLTGAYDAVAEDLRSGRPGHPSDPLSSAPEVVAAVVEQLGVPEPSARYWLQLLALIDPTDANLVQWNQWRKRQRDAAAAPLLDTGLVVVDKRPRAGRRLFIRGPWVSTTAPHLPFEAWKAPLYGLSARTNTTPPMDLAVPVTPMGEHFEAAWKRYLTDPPR